MPLFIFPHPQCPYHMRAHAPVSQLVSSCQFPMFYARQCEATRRDWWREPTTRVFNGSRHVTVLQYCKLHWLLRGFLRFIISVEDCKLYENSESGRRKLPLLVWTNDFPFILQAHTVFTFEEGICRSLNLSRTLTEFVSNLTHFSHCLINERNSATNDKVSSLLSLTASRNSRCLTRTIRVLCTNDTQMAEVVVVLSILNYNILRLRCHATTRHQVIGFLF